MPRKTNVCLAAAAALLAAGCGGNGMGRADGGAPGVAGAAAGKPIPSVQTKAAPALLPSAPPTTAATAAASTTSTTSMGSTGSTGSAESTDPGTLPQTHALPGAQDPQFQAGVQTLWRAIVQDKPELAQPFFFPLSAYKQVKAIPNPAADYQDRLTAWYRLDIKAAHDHLGAAAATAKLVGVSVPESDAEWIEPGAEYNKGSYYRVYGSRLNYLVNGHYASIGVFSLISWRGEWYVVHLGPSTRSAMEGIVYDPEG